MRKAKNKIYQEIISYLKKHNANKIAVFGSYLHNEETPESDIDIIVEFKDAKTFLDFVRIERELSESLGIKVDLLTEDGISPLLIDRVKEDMKIIYQ